jgi:cytochrome c oxidase cbb3-type subunit 3
MNTDPNETPIDVEDLRPHTFDGIQEYDKRLPNWWLWTFYLAIIYAVGYWTLGHNMGLAPDPGSALKSQMFEARTEALKNSPQMSDEKLWAMSQDAAIIGAGKQTFETTCAACHRPDLTGQIGPNLRDQQWVHGGTPLVVAKTITEGVLAKGMPAWAPILGSKKIGEVCAYIFSYHHEGEPVEIKPWVPVMPTAAQ